jgi:predicted CopG family antitoxin
LVKTITIREEVYNKLSDIKREHESFSQLFEGPAEKSDPHDALTAVKARVKFGEKREHDPSHAKFKSGT